MPKSTRNIKEVEDIREKILIIAMGIIVSQGFDNFSMRKLASKLNMTAANIYNYFSNKDEIYLKIQTKGFQILYDFLEEISNSPLSLQESISSVINGYIEFGTNNKNYYDIMLNSPAPKYSDYVGTKMENTAKTEKETALKNIDIVVDILTKRIPNLCPIKTRTFIIKIWSRLHGLIILYNKNILSEVVENPEIIINEIKNDLIKEIEKFLITEGAEI